MKKIYLILSIQFLVGLSNVCQGQEPTMWEIEKHEIREKIRQKDDSIALQSRKFLPAFTFNLKTQFPVQHAVGLEFSTPSFLSFYIGAGQLSRAYVVTAANFLPDNDLNQATRKQFIRDKLQNGFVFELGTHYHILRWRGVYAGLNLQFQRFALPATPEELVEKYDFGDSQGFNPEIQELLENNSRLQDFYENTILEPVISPIQLGVTVGKRFHFKKNNRLFLDLEFSYQLNLKTRVKISSESFVGQILVDSFITPILNDGSANSFGSFNLPSISLRLGFQLGKKIHHQLH